MVIVQEIQKDQGGVIERNVIHHGDALTELRKMPDGVSDAHTIQDGYLILEGLHLFADLNWPLSRADMTTPTGDAQFLAPVLESPEGHTSIGLSVFDSQKRSDSQQETVSVLVGHVPSLHGPSSLGRWVGNESVSTEKTMCKIDCTGFDLLNRHTLRVSRLSAITDHAHRIGVFLDPDCSIGVNNASQVCQFDSFHKPSTQEYT